jgi:hypothetical protein
MKISNYIINLYDENLNPTSIKTDNDFDYYENNFDVELSDATIRNIKIIKYTCVDPNIVEFLNDNLEVLQKAKGFDSVL